MHIAVIWDITAPAPRWSEIDTSLKKCLAGYVFFQALPTFYVIKTNTDADRVIIKDRLTNYVKDLTERVYFVVTPSMVGGQYDGWLPTDRWVPLNEKTK